MNADASYSLAALGGLSPSFELPFMGSSRAVGFQEPAFLNLQTFTTSRLCGLHHGNRIILIIIENIKQCYPVLSTSTTQLPPSNRSHLCTPPKSSNRFTKSRSIIFHGTYLSSTIRTITYHNQIPPFIQTQLTHFTSSIIGVDSISFISRSIYLTQRV